MERKEQAEATSEKALSLDNALFHLTGAGIISDEERAEILRKADVTAAKIKHQVRTRESDHPYVSPLEVISAIHKKFLPPGKSVDEGEIYQAYANKAGIRFIRIDPLKLDSKSVCSIVSKPFARKNLLVPVKLEGGKLTVAMVNPYDREAIQSLEDVTGYTIEPVLGLRSEILKTINEIFAFEHSLIKAEESRLGKKDLGNLEQLVEIAGEGEPDASDHYVIQAVDLLLQYAYDQMASDIHIEPKRGEAVVRLRIDGRLQSTHRIPKKVYPSFVSRIKIMASLDIAEKRKPQDGRIKTKHGEMEIELRVSTVPMAFGEKVVIRIFDPNILMQELSTLGFFPDQLERFKAMLSKPYGIILVTGPTGSGKTTTLYSALRYLSNPEVNITTIEDPIEMVYDPFNQIAVQPQIDLTFTRALKHVLRQDPDIIMIGEIRDKETAEYAVQAALTGHLVLTTLHTNNASSAVTRLRDLGIESYLIASTLIGVIAQRLVRRVCTYCSTGARLTPAQMELLGIDGGSTDLSNMQKGIGCLRCRNTGYKGRTGIFELLEVDERIRALIRDDVDEKTISSASQQAGMEPLLNSGIKNLMQGKTTLEEILRVVPLVR